jgi:hypothetical protein
MRLRWLVGIVGGIGIVGIVGGGTGEAPTVVVT